MRWACFGDGRLVVDFVMRRAIDLGARARARARRRHRRSSSVVAWRAWEVQGESKINRDEGSMWPGVGQCWRLAQEQTPNTSTNTSHQARAALAHLVGQCCRTGGKAADLAKADEQSMRCHNCCMLATPWAQSMINYGCCLPLQPYSCWGE